MMDYQTAAEHIIKICETYKSQNGHYPTEIKVNDEIWRALHGEAHSKIIFPLPTPETIDFNFPPINPLNPPEIPLVTLTLLQTG